MSHSSRLYKDKLMSRIMQVLTLSSIFTLFFIAAGLLYKSLPILTSQSLSEILFSSEWFPLKSKFGFLPFIVGTLTVTGIAIAIAVPLCLLCAIYLSEYAPKKVISFVNPLIDILSGLPSVIFGVWGIITVVPLIKNYIGPFFGYTTSGYSVLAGGIVLAIMVFPVIIHVLLEVFATIHPDLRNASLSLGATKWQTIKKVVLRKAAPGILSAIVLGLSRAFGETLAVLLVVGNVAKLPKSIFDPAYPIPALIANNYGETLSIPLYDSAMMLASFILFIIVLIFNLVSRMILKRLQKNAI